MKESNSDIENKTKSTQYPSATANLLVDRAFHHPDAQACIDWAVSMLERGYDSNNLTILAGLTPQLNHFEIADYLERALKEVGLANIDSSAVIAHYLSSQLLPALNNKTKLKAALQKLKDIHISSDYSSNLKDFYLLYHAYTDLQEADSQYYWEGATRDNITSIIRQRAKDYIQSHCISHCI